jgi:hypothetical protein
MVMDSEVRHVEADGGPMLFWGKGDAYPDGVPRGIVIEGYCAFQIA